MSVAKKITINDVALAAGVSVSTVSLVLSGKGRISHATGERVNEAIEKLGFVRNRQAVSLRGGQSGVIGLMVRDLSSPFYAELTAGLSEALEAQGRMLFLTQCGRDADQSETLLRHAALPGRGRRDYRRRCRRRCFAARYGGGASASAAVCLAGQPS